MDGSVALRHIGSRDVLFGTDDSTSLQNINTTELDDGALCYVVGEKAYYILDKLSVAATTGKIIVLPESGPGRWVFFGGLEDSLLWAAYSMQTGSMAIQGLTQSTWANPTPSSFALDSPVGGPGPALWTLDASTGVIAYSGESGKSFEVTVNASVACGTAAAVSVEVVAATAGLIGTTAEDFYAGRATTVATANVETQISSSKIMTLANTETIRPAFRNLTGTQNLEVERLSVVITAVD